MSDEPAAKRAKVAVPCDGDMDVERISFTLIESVAGFKTFTGVAPGTVLGVRALCQGWVVVWTDQGVYAHRGSVTVKLGDFWVQVRARVFVGWSELVIRVLDARERGGARPRGLYGGAGRVGARAL